MEFTGIDAWIVWSLAFTGWVYIAYRRVCYLIGKIWFKKVEVIKIDSQVLTLKPDDILVLSCPYNLSDEQFVMLKKQWGKATVGKHIVILLEGGGKLSILRRL